MAQVVKTILTDDVDGSEGSESFEFEWDGQRYQIDLGDANAKQIKADFGAWIKHARKATTGGRKAGKPRAMPNRDLAQVRAWSRENGYTVSDRGRISQEVLDAFDAAVGR
jgi:hypothetical protein